MSANNLEGEDFKSKRLKTELVLRCGPDARLYDKGPQKEQPLATAKVEWGLESDCRRRRQWLETPLEGETVRNPKKG
jgi:hypothetical protein